jgi:hypothetical protein
MPKHLIRPDHARNLLDSLRSHVERQRLCDEQVARWEVAVYEHPTPRSHDAHQFWLNASAAEHGDLMGHAVDDYASAVLTPRQARRIIG